MLVNVWLQDTRDQQFDVPQTMAPALHPTALGIKYSDGIMIAAKTIVLAMLVVTLRISQAGFSTSLGPLTFDW